MFFSNTHWPQLMAPFYSILYKTSICRIKNSKFSPLMPDEVREHLARDQRPFLHPESLQILQIHSSMTVLLLFSSPTHFLQGSGQRTGMAIAEAWFCAQGPIFVLFLRFVFGLLSSLKIQTWPIIRFLKSVTCWFFICWYLIESMMPCSLNKMSRTSIRNIGPQHQKYCRIFHCTHWGTFYPCVHQTHLERLLLKRSFFFFIWPFEVPVVSDNWICWSLFLDELG